MNKRRSPFSGLQGAKTGLSSKGFRPRLSLGSLFSQKTFEIFSKISLRILWAFLLLGFAAIFWFTLLGAPAAAPIEGAAPQIYGNQIRDDLSGTLHASLMRAKKSIFIQVFTLSDPSLLKAITKKAKEPISIHIHTDSKEAARLKKKLPKSVLVTAGSKTGLMHRKIVVIDQKEIWLGSANLTWESLKMNANLILGFSSPELAQYFHAPPADGHGEFHFEGQPIEFWLLPESLDADRKLLAQIEQAKKCLRVAMFTFTRQDFADALIRAKNRGVNVQVAIDRGAGLGAGKYVTQKLQEAGIALKLSKGPQILHHKFVWIDPETDQSRVILGSCNWTKAAFSKNSELLIQLPFLTVDQEVAMHKIWNCSWENAEVLR